MSLFGMFSSFSLSKSFSSISSAITYLLLPKNLFLDWRYLSNCLCPRRRNSSEITSKKAPTHAAKNSKDDLIWRVGKRKQASMVSQFRSIYRSQLWYDNDQWKWRQVRWLRSLSPKVCRCHPPLTWKLEWHYPLMGLLLPSSLPYLRRTQRNLTYPVSCRFTSRASLHSRAGREQAEFSAKGLRYMSEEAKYETRPQSHCRRGWEFIVRRCVRFWEFKPYSYIWCSNTRIGSWLIAILVSWGNAKTQTFLWLSLVGACGSEPSFLEHPTVQLPISLAHDLRMLTCFQVQYPPEFEGRCYLVSASIRGHGHDIYSLKSAPLCLMQPIRTAEASL